MKKLNCFFIIIFLFNLNLYSQSCTSPQPLIPANGSNINTLTPTLCWLNGLGWISDVTLQVSLNAAFNNTILQYQIPIGSECYTVPNGYLSYNTIYYWRFRSICYNYNYIYSSVFYFVPVLVGLEMISTEIPDRFNLFPNYPNPFNPITKIKFDVPASLSFGEGPRVRLIIYDILGREVTTLVNEALKPGSYEAEWPATGGGSNFASGIYFYSLQTEEFTQTKKMVLMK